jgi:hypothetical protein
LWESQTAVEAQPEIETQNVAQGEQESQGMSEETVHNAVENHRTLTVSANDFAGLEERVLRTIALVKQEREARAAAEGRAERAEASFAEAVAKIEQLQSDLSAMRTEREQVKTRVERLLEQLDALEV